MNPRPGVLPTVAVQDSDRPSGSLACPACAGIAEVGDPKSGWLLAQWRHPGAPFPCARRVGGTRSRPLLRSEANHG
jgi:hypothetical protein